MNQRHWGLDPGQLARIRAVLAAHPKVSKVIIYGARALGTNHAGSDIDLTAREAKALLPLREKGWDEGMPAGAGVGGGAITPPSPSLPLPEGEGSGALLPFAGEGLG